MESRVVSPVHSVFAVDISHHEEGVVVRLLKDGNLMRRGVRAQTQISIEVVGVSGTATDVVFRDEKSVEAVLRVDCRVKIGEQLELLAWHPDLRELVLFGLEKIEGLIDEGSERMLRVLI